VLLRALRGKLDPLGGNFFGGFLSVSGLTLCGETSWGQFLGEVRLGDANGLIALSGRRANWRGRTLGSPPRVNDRVVRPFLAIPAEALDLTLNSVERIDRTHLVVRLEVGRSHRDDCARRSKIWQLRLSLGTTNVEPF